MKKFYFFLIGILLLLHGVLNAQRHLIINTTGYGFDRNAANGINPGQWDYIQKFVNLTYNGQDAGVTAIRFHIQWEQYEPTPGVYYGTKLAQAMQAMKNLKPGMKIALHFPYLRQGPMPGQTIDPFLTDDEIARIYDGTKVEQTISWTCLSVFNASTRQRFINFVNNAMSAISAYYNDILYVEMGNGDAEEFIMPILQKNGSYWSGMYENAAVQSWRTEYLPCRYPGQSTVTWNGQTYNIASAPTYAPPQWGDFNNEHGREYHRFGTWGLMRLYKQFRDAVKSHNSNIKVLYFTPGFGTSAGNLTSLQNATFPMALNEFDGIYTSEGNNEGDAWRKIMPIDVLKGTNPNKIAAIEFDPTDMGAPSPNDNLYANMVDEWFARAYKHGAEYIHMAMHFSDNQISQLAPHFAALKATYITGSFTPPSRQSPVTANIAPNVFTGAFLFDDAWNNQGGNNWSVTDLSPKSVSMNENGYWQNVWSCTPTNPCDYNISASGPSGNITVNSSVTLSSTCSGQCSGVSYAWSGNGISGSNTSVTFNAPSTAGTYTYTITASKSGCTAKTSNVNITVVTDGGGGNPCNYVDKQTVGTWSGLNVQTRQYTVNGSAAWLIVTAVPGSSVDKHFPRGKNFADRGDISWSVTINKACLGGGETGYGGLVLPSGITVPSGYTQGTEPDGAVYFQQTCTPPSAPTLNASPSTINSGSSSTLTASGCSGGTITWSNGLGTGTSKTVSPTTTTTYTATCSVGGCTSSNASVTVTVNTSGGGPDCGSVLSDVNGANCLFIEGWVYDPSNPNGTVYVDIYEGSTLLVANAPASKFRQDLLDAGFGNGQHGLEVNTPASLRDGQSHVLTFKIVGCGNQQMNNSPKTLSGCSNAMLDPTEYPNPLKVTPNPGKGVFETYFYVERGKKATLVVNDLHGRIIYSKQIIGNGNHRETINLTNKASGTLLLRLYKDGAIEVKKINIAR